MMSRLRFMLLLCLGCAGLAVAATPAVAGTDHFCAGNYVGAGDACADGGTHSGAFYVEVTVDHTGCAAFNNGHGGIYTANNGTTDTWAFACTVGSGTNGGNTPGWVGSVHGTMLNPNGSTTDYIYDAHVSW
jgi:hypothetical protein